MTLNLRQPVAAPDLFSFPKYWAECYGVAPYLPMSRAEMDDLGWDSCDIILVTGDAYVDHPGCTDEDMLNLSLWLKNNDFRVDQVQTFIPRQWL